MRISAALLALAASASARSILGDDQVVISDDDHQIPGKSPMEHCPGDFADDILQITSIDLDPNPPEAGKTLDIVAAGIVKERIEEGAKIHLTVKYGLIRLINTEQDLCEQVKNVDKECPIEKGPLAITKSVDLPNEIPPGKYTVLADVRTKDDKPITCLTATVQFSRGGAVLDFLEL